MYYNKFNILLLCTFLYYCMDDILYDVPMSSLFFFFFFGRIAITYTRAERVAERERKNE